MLPQRGDGLVVPLDGLLEPRFPAGPLGGDGVVHGGSQLALAARDRVPPRGPQGRLRVLMLRAQQRDRALLLVPLRLQSLPPRPLARGDREGPPPPGAPLHPPQLPPPPP